MRNSYLAIPTVLSLAILAITLPAGAKDKDPEAPPQSYNELQACRTIIDEKARLDCFDAASAKIAREVDAKELVMLDRTAVKNTKKSLFGFSIPDVDFLKDEEGKFEFTKLETAITSASSAGRRKWQFRITEGSLWRTTEASDIEFKKGQKVVISKGSLGGYFVKVGSARSVRVLREE